MRKRSSTRPSASPRGRSVQRRVRSASAWGVEALEPRTLLAFAPLGPEFRVNTFNANAQGEPAVASDADGDFVMAWESYAQDGSSFGVYAQRYNAAGAAQGGEFRVNTTTAGSQRR